MSFEEGGACPGVQSAIASWSSRDSLAELTAVRLTPNPVPPIYCLFQASKVVENVGSPGAYKIPLTLTPQFQRSALGDVVAF